MNGILYSNVSVHLSGLPFHIRVELPVLAHCIRDLRSIYWEPTVWSTSSISFEEHWLVSSIHVHSIRGSHFATAIASWHTPSSLWYKDKTDYSSPSHQGKKIPTATSLAEDSVQIYVQFFL